MLLNVSLYESSLMFLLGTYQKEQIWYKRKHCACYFLKSLMLILNDSWTINGQSSKMHLWNFILNLLPNFKYVWKPLYLKISNSFSLTVQNAYRYIVGFSLYRLFIVIPGIRSCTTSPKVELDEDLTINFLMLPWFWIFPFLKAIKKINVLQWNEGLNKQ